MHSLILPANICLQLEQQATASPDRESCCLLSGFNRDGTGEILNWLPLHNLSRHPHHFQISKNAWSHAVAQVQTLGHDILVLGHSHPQGPVEPSQTDLRNLANSAFPWLITGWNNHQFCVRAFEAGSGEEITVRLTSKAD